MMAKSVLLRKGLGLAPFDPEWSLRSRLADNPMVWMLKTKERANPGECFKNAFDLASDDPKLIYCEGFVLGPRVAVHHAWVTDGTGRVIDNTLTEPATAYAGVPFGTSFLNVYHLRNRAVICLLDDYLHDWPMLCELGDRPDEWLEQTGKGIARLPGR